MSTAYASTFSDCVPASTPTASRYRRAPKFKQRAPQAHDAPRPVPAQRSGHVDVVVAGLRCRDDLLDDALEDFQTLKVASAEQAPPQPAKSKAKPKANAKPKAKATPKAKAKPKARRVSAAVTKIDDEEAEVPETRAKRPCRRRTGN